MLLAEALQLRGDLQTRMEQLRQRLYDNATVQEGMTPAEDPEALFREYGECVTQWEELAARINRTNSQTQVGDSTLTECLARRDGLKHRASTYREFLQNASRLTTRSTRGEIKIFSSVSVPKYRKEADALAKELRELDNAIQAANWRTELL